MKSIKEYTDGKPDQTSAKEQKKSETELPNNKHKAEQDLETEAKNMEVQVPVSKKLNSGQLSKLLEIKMKKNEAINLNNKAVLEEEKEANDPGFLKRVKREKWEVKKKELDEELKFKGIDEKKLYLNQPAIKFEQHHDTDQKKKPEVFGWNGIKRKIFLKFILK